jgi:hypothetical protein
MTTEDLVKLTREIVAEARQLNTTHTSEHDAPVNYACIFAHNPAQYDDLVNAARHLGSVADETPTGPVFHISPLSTDAGSLRLLKIRKPSPERPERGDADFTVANYDALKKTHLGRPGFRLVQRPRMEMLELIDPSFSVLAYYSHPTLAELLQLKANE